MRILLRIILGITLCTIITMPINAQSSLPDSIQVHIDSVINLTERTHLNRTKINWEEMRSEIKTRTANAKKVKDILPALQYMLVELEDFHGRFIYKKTPWWGAQKEYNRGEMDWTDSLLQAYRQSTIQFRAELLDIKTAYLCIPPMQYGVRDSANGAEIKLAICSLQALGANRWVLDLRLNGGGTMWPMLAGLESLLGNGTVGYFIDPSSDYEEGWVIKDGVIAQGEYPQISFPSPYCEGKNATKDPVAVLISAATTSSGEIVAISFKGREYTRFFGEKTGAYTTTVAYREIAPDFVFLWTVSFYADRNKNPYNATAVFPDEHIIGGENFNKLMLDTKVISAYKWFDTIK